MFRTLVRLLASVSLAALLFVPALGQELSFEEAAKALPDRVGDFRAAGPAFRLTKGGVFETAAPESFEAVGEAARRYSTADGGGVLTVTVIKTRSEGAAYSLLTRETEEAKTGCEVGAACALTDSRLAFSRGPAYVSIDSSGNPPGAPALMDFARQFSETLDAGGGGVPVLVLHLPEWEKAQQQADYAVSLSALQSAAGNRPVLDALSFEGGTEAVTAVYGGARLVIVEFTTPQYAQDNDARVGERIGQLKAEGRPVPAYRRVGNYSVFVFDAAGESEAAQLIEQVKYEKDVRWLGDNPRILEQAQQAYRATMGGVLVTTLKATGLAIVICLGIGGLVGGSVFLYRRARSTASEIYSDAGGMLRLNIEDVNAPHGPAKLIGDAKK